MAIVTVGIDLAKNLFALHDGVTFSEYASELFRLVGRPTPTWTELRGLLHPDDADRAGLGVEQALAHRTQYDIEYRLRIGPAHRWIRAQGKGVYGDKGGGGGH